MAKVITEDEARRIASNIAKLPILTRKGTEASASVGVLFTGRRLNLRLQHAGTLPGFGRFRASGTEAEDEITILATTATIVLAASIVEKAEAATMTQLGSLAPRAKSYTTIEKAGWRRRAYRRGYYGYGYPSYGYGYYRPYPYYGYGYYRPYPYYGYGYGPGYGWRY